MDLERVALLWEGQLCVHALSTPPRPLCPLGGVPWETRLQEQVWNLSIALTLSFVLSSDAASVVLSKNTQMQNCRLQPWSSLFSIFRIESNDLPLLTAVASTHSPHVAQILL